MYFVCSYNALTANDFILRFSIKPHNAATLKSQFIEAGIGSQERVDKHACHGNGESSVGVNSNWE